MIGVSLEVVTKFGIDKHTLNERILPSEVWHIKYPVVSIIDHGIRAEIALIWNTVQCFVKIEKQRDSALSFGSLEFIFHEMSAVSFISEVVFSENQPLL